MIEPRTPPHTRNILFISSVVIVCLMLAVVSLTYAAPMAVSPEAQITTTATGQSTTTITPTVTLTVTTQPTATTEMWQRLNFTSPVPQERCAHSLIWDAANQRLILYGGRSDDGGVMEGVWEHTVANGWRRLTPELSGPVPPRRADHSAIYDAANNRMIIFGGVSTEANITGFLDDIWALNLTPGAESWVPLFPTAGGVSPERRAGHTAIYDPTSQRMIIFGGRGALLTTATTTPTPAVTSTPSIGGTVTPTPGGTVTFQDMWAFNLGQGGEGWVQLISATTAPDRRSDHAAVYDAQNRRMVIFGGRRFNQSLNLDVVTEDVWSVGLNNLTSAPITGTVPISWTILTPATSPEARASMAYTYDPQRQRMIIFGGIVGTSPGQPTASAQDTWALDLRLGQENWTNLVPSGPRPQPRNEAAMMYVPPLNGAVMVGGCSDTGEGFEETWLLSPAAQATVTPGTGTPGATGTVTPGTGTPGATGTVTPGTGTPGATGTVTPGTGTPGATGTVTPSTGTPGATGTVTPSTGTPGATGTVTPVTGTPTVTRTVTPGTGTPGATGTVTPGTGTPGATGTVTPGTGTPGVTRTATPSTGTPVVTPQPTAPAMGNGVIIIRAFIDHRCDGFYTRGYDWPLAGMTVTATLPDGSTRVAILSEDGTAVITGVGSMSASSMIEITGDDSPPLPAWVQQGGYNLVPCPGSPTVRLTARDFGFFGVAFVDLRYNLSGGGR